MKLKIEIILAALLLCTLFLLVLVSGSKKVTLAETILDDPNELAKDLEDVKYDLYQLDYDYQWQKVLQEDALKEVKKK